MRQAEVGHVFQDVIQDLSFRAGLLLEWCRVGRLTGGLTLIHNRTRSLALSPSSASTLCTPFASQGWTDLRAWATRVASLDLHLAPP